MQMQSPEWCTMIFPVGSSIPCPPTMNSFLFNVARLLNWRILIWIGKYWSGLKRLMFSLSMLLTSITDLFSIFFVSQVLQINIGVTSCHAAVRGKVRWTSSVTNWLCPWKHRYHFQASDLIPTYLLSKCRCRYAVSQHLILDLFHVLHYVNVLMYQLRISYYVLCNPSDP
jgi:hypothetical protein